MSYNRINDYMKVYLAGKISKNDWRHDLFLDLRLAKIRKAQYRKIPKRNGLIYNGPFFESCDHGCAHGDSNHGQGLNNNGCYANDNTPRSKVFKSCMKGIEGSDFIFCWIDEETVYGTLIEIGYAFAKMKPIFIATPKDASFIKDFWFAAQCSGKIIQANDHTEAWIQFEKWIGKKVRLGRKERNYSPITEPQISYISGLIEESSRYFMKSEKLLRELDRVTASQIIDSLKRGFDVASFYDEIIGYIEDSEQDQFQEGASSQGQVSKQSRFGYSVNLSYPALIKQDGDAWIVSFPDLDNINTSGDSFEHALQMAEEALNATLEVQIKQNTLINGPSHHQQFDAMIAVHPDLAEAISLKRWEMIANQHYTSKARRSL